jgi:hypothetical protein
MYATKKYPGAEGAAPGARKSNSQSAPNNPIIEPTQALASPVYLLRLRSIRGGNEIGRLRAALKLLRAFGFRCLSIGEERR